MNSTLDHLWNNKIHTVWKAFEILMGMNIKLNLILHPILLLTRETQLNQLQNTFVVYIDNWRRRSLLNGTVIAYMAAAAAFPFPRHANQSDALPTTITHQHQTCTCTDILTSDKTHSLWTSLSCNRYGRHVHSLGTCARQRLVDSSWHLSSRVLATRTRRTVAFLLELGK